MSAAYAKRMENEKWKMVILNSNRPKKAAFAVGQLEQSEKGEKAHFMNLQAHFNKNNIFLPLFPLFPFSP